MNSAKYLLGAFAVLGLACSLAHAGDIDGLNGRGIREVQGDSDSVAGSRMKVLNPSGDVEGVNGNCTPRRLAGLPGDLDGVIGAVLAPGDQEGVSGFRLLLWIWLP